MFESRESKIHFLKESTRRTRFAMKRALFFAIVMAIAATIGCGGASTSKQISRRTVLAPCM